jgi:hypothetical protein
LVREASDRISGSACKLTGGWRQSLDAEYFPISPDLMHGSEIRG